MRAFLAMGWDDRDREVSRVAAAMAEQAMDYALSPAHVLSGAGIFMSDLSGRPHSSLVPVSCDGARTEGVVFGTLFSKVISEPHYPRVLSIQADHAASMIRSAGEELIARYWGSYVALLRTPAGPILITDPTSAIPCFWAQRSGVTIAFSHLEHSILLQKADFSINYGFVSSLLAYDKIQNGQTGINEVSELGGGQRLNIRNTGHTITTLWDPRQVAASPLRVSPKSAAAKLRAETCAVIESWAACYDHLIVNTSGGLDSSIVLAAACQGIPAEQVTAVHSILDSGDTTEAGFARAAADMAGCHYYEISAAARRSLPDIEGHPATARPYRQFLAPEFQELEDGQAATANEAIFTGQGGDHLFHVSRNPNIFADFLRTSGNPFRLPSELYNAARLSGRSVWSVLATAVPGAIHPAQNAALKHAISLRRTPINSAAHDQLNMAELLPPWTCDARGLPPAKFDQVASLPHLFQVRRPLDRTGSRDVIHPLVSQPLIELCLRLPTYTLCANGVSRGLARLAFSGDVPSSILRRMTKGSASRHYMNHVGLHAEQLADALCDGALVKAGLVDPASVKAFLRLDGFRNHISGHMVLVYYAIEAWLRTWDRAISGRRALE